MGGPSSDSGSSDGPNTTGSTVTKVRKKNPIVDFIAGGGVTGAIIRTVKKGIEKNKAKAKDIKINESYLGSSDYQGDVAKKSRNITPPDNDRDDNNKPTIASVTNKKSIEQPKVKSQMNNKDVKSDLITAKGPTSAEMSDDQISLKNKRKGRKNTVLTSVTGVNDYPTLSKKTLLG